MNESELSVDLALLAGEETVELVEELLDDALSEQVSKMLAVLDATEAAVAKELRSRGYSIINHQGIREAILAAWLDWLIET